MRTKRIIGSLVATAALCLLAACSPAPTPTPTPSPYPTDLPTDVFCPQPPNWYSYITQPGDSIRSLADRTGSTFNELAFANCLNNPRGILYSGQVFYLPRPPISP